MARISVCIEMVFADRPFLERIDAVADAGVGAVEFWGLKGKDVDAIGRRAAARGLEVATFAGAGGHSLVDADQLDLVREGFVHAAEVARSLGTGTLLLTTGNALPHLSRAQQKAVLVGNLKAAAEVGERSGITFVLEPLNTRVDHVGYFLDRTDEAAEIVEAVGSERVRILYDIYHQQIMEGDLIATIRRYAPLIGHYHLADVPGRHEPGTGEINYRNVIRAIDATGYQGYVGFEYRPTGDHLEGLRAGLRAVGA